MSYPIRNVAAAAALSLLAVGCGSEDTQAAGSGYQVTIRRTSYGIPHVLAKDVPSAAAGLGYAGAEDYGCILLDQMVMVRSERSRFFGPGAGEANVNSDFGMLTLGVIDRGKRGLAAQSAAMKANLDGYVAGFNHYVATKPLAAECDGKEWVGPITAESLFAYFYWVSQLGSDAPLFDTVAAAAPPSDTGSSQQNLSAALPQFHPDSIGSNGWAIGKERTSTGRGMLIANPHFPWEGNLKLYESHITVPGTLNVYGASLLGVPVILIGFNEHVAWTHTVTTARHFTLYRLDLAPGDPTSYLVDGTPRAMKSEDFSIKVLNDDGSLEEQHRTLWRSHYGPIVDISALGGWSSTTAYTYRNANEDNFDISEHWLQMDRAKSLDELQEINDTVHGNPWTNTMAVDADGHTLYMDATRTPNLSATALSAYEDALANDPLTQAVDSNGATLLNGSDSAFEWQDDDARIPGIVAYARSPKQTRDDYIFNANDSFWLTNSHAPLTNYSILFGDQRTERSRRTRMNLMMLDETTAAGASGADGKFSFDELTRVEFSDRASMSEILRDQVVARCRNAGANVPDAVVKACGVLEAWDGRYLLDSAGAPLFREFLAAFDADPNLGPLFEDSFDPDDPVATPKTLVSAPASEEDPVLVALVRAADLLQKAGFFMDATLGELQHTKKGSAVIPIHGGTNRDGAFNIVDYNSDSGTLLASTKRGTVVTDANGTPAPTGLTADGYLINNGSSFMMALEYTDEGPHAQAVLSYSESSDPSSPHYADQTKLFSASKYRPVLFTEDDIQADDELVVTELTIP